jgi:phospholipase C
MDTRREFLKTAMLLSGAAGMATLPPSILKALSIDPDLGTTFLDAEHIVLLMQENRSFDHTFGTLRGVRGFSDPRAMTLPDLNKVWLQKSAAGETYTPFRFDIKDTKITWMGSLPHGRESQTGARNNGGNDNWIEAKKADDENYAHMPLTMGYYTREDIPFYYALADAFTVCDQNFCSSLTPTDPNRLYFFSGTVRAEHDENSRAFIDNDSIERGVEWRAFPELLEQHNISWKVYQNEISAGGGFTEEEDAWLSNFGDNTLEFFNQYNIKLSKRYVDYLPTAIAKLEQELKDEEAKLPSLAAGSKELKDAQEKLKTGKELLASKKEDEQKFTREKFDNLSSYDKAIHEKAFAVNDGDPYQHELMPLQYTDDATDRLINIPKGDVLHKFRQDVENGKLPTVSWLAAPQTFSDHPSAPWFGSWYLSEVMDILTKNPEVWKKTIFVLAYDENDGYFDHVPPFTAPDHRNPATGKVSAGIDTSTDRVIIEKDVPGSIGLGFRVPLIIASPWSRGGYVNSQVFDHTSTLQFLEVFLNNKFKKDIKETNITQWRRTVCGDLTSTFRKYNGDKITGLPFVERQPFIESIYNAKFKNVPSNYKALTAQEIQQVNTKPDESSYMPQQEKGTRPACALPYELFADGNYNKEKNRFEITLGAGNDIFKDVAVGAPFIIQSRNFLHNDFTEKNYAVIAGDRLQDEWHLDDFLNKQYHLQVYGPNGFYRTFKGNDNDPDLQFSLSQNKNGAQLRCVNNSSENYTVTIKDNAYKSDTILRKVPGHANSIFISIPLDKSGTWYDFTLTVSGNTLMEKRYAGHIETGKESISDPAMA